MARALSQLLEISEPTSGIVRHRWQNYYLNSSVSYAGKAWAYQDFSCDGLANGQQQSVSLTLPATPLVLGMVSSATAEGWLIEVSNYQFDFLVSDTAPQSDQSISGSFLGEVIGARGGLYEITLELGSSLAPVGAQFPPRQLTTQLVGSPCRF